jgi:rare lipoprotein A
MFSNQSKIFCQSAITISVLLTLSACSIYRPGSPETPDQDAGPGHAVDISHISDAVPQKEPLSRYGNPESYVVFGQRYHLLESRQGYKQRGIASWYGTKFHGRRTSSGEPYDMYAMTAAHKTLPIPTYARVTNLDSGNSIIVKINDRGPFVDGRIIDLSYVAARKLGISAKGTGRVEVQTIVPGAPSLTYEQTPVLATTKVQTTPAGQTPEPLEPLAYASPQTNNLYLQVGIFRDRSNAERLREDLTRLSLPDTHVATDTSTQQTLYRVRIGPLSKDEEADQLIETLAQQGHKGFRIRID